jgi:hypothetical protein
VSKKGVTLWNVIEKSIVYTYVAETILCSAADRTRPQFAVCSRQMVEEKRRKEDGKVEKREKGKNERPRFSFSISFFTPFSLAPVDTVILVDKPLACSFVPSPKEHWCLILIKFMLSFFT